MKIGRTLWTLLLFTPLAAGCGGGEGRASGGHPRSRKGLLAKGYKTRHPKRHSDKHIIERKKKK